MAGDSDEPAAVVRGFIAAMHDWEFATAAAFRAAMRAGVLPPSEEAVAQVRAVFGRYCTPRTHSRTRGVSFAEPPEYQPEHEAVLGVEAGSLRRAVVETQQGTGFRQRRRYMLVRWGGQWLIDSVKWKQHDGTWGGGAL